MRVRPWLLHGLTRALSGSRFSNRGVLVVGPCLLRGTLPSGSSSSGACCLVAARPPERGPPGNRRQGVRTAPPPEDVHDEVELAQHNSATKGRFCQGSRGVVTERLLCWCWSPAAEGE